MIKQKHAFTILYYISIVINQWLISKQYVNIYTTIMCFTMFKLLNLLPSNWLLSSPTFYITRRASRRLSPKFSLSEYRNVNQKYGPKYISIHNRGDDSVSYLIYIIELRIFLHLASFMKVFNSDRSLIMISVLLTNSTRSQTKWTPVCSSGLTQQSCARNNKRNTNIFPFLSVKLSPHC